MVNIPDPHGEHPMEQHITIIHPPGSAHTIIRLLAERLKHTTKMWYDLAALQTDRCAESEAAECMAANRQICETLLGIPWRDEEGTNT